MSQAEVLRRDPERTKHKAVRVKSKSQWRPQGLGNARNITASTEESRRHHVDSSPDKARVL